MLQNTERRECLAGCALKLESVFYGLANNTRPRAETLQTREQSSNIDIKQTISRLPPTWCELCICSLPRIYDRKSGWCNIVNLTESASNVTICKLMLWIGENGGRLTNLDQPAEMKISCSIRHPGRLLH